MTLTCQCQRCKATVQFDYVPNDYISEQFVRNSFVYSTCLGPLTLC